MVRRKTLLEVNLFDPEFPMAQDWDMWLRIAERGIWARGIREPMVRYRRWPGSMTIVNQMKSIDYNALVIKKHLRTVQRPDLVPLYRRSLALAQTNCENGARPATRRNRSRRRPALCLARVAS